MATLSIAMAKYNLAIMKVLVLLVSVMAHDDGMWEVTEAIDGQVDTEILQLIKDDIVAKSM